MEQPDPAEYKAAPVEREPQPHDVALVFRAAVEQLMPGADWYDVNEAVVSISQSVDFEDALGDAVSQMAMLGIEPDEGLALLAEALHIEQINPNGDQPNGE